MNTIQYHNIPPVWDKNSKILILGSFPSVKSREAEFFYHHPRNRFWQVISQVLGEAAPQTVGQKTQMLLAHGIALWDVIASCEIYGSADSSIKNAVPNDLSAIINGCSLRGIFTNGSAAAKAYDKYLFPIWNIPAVRLPSTSPANAAWSLPRLVDAYSIINKYLN